MKTKAAKNVQKLWGLERIIYSSNLYTLKVLHFAGHAAKLSMHYHLDKTETWLVISGLYVFETINPSTCERTREELEPGDTVHIPRGTMHSLTVVESGDIAEVSTPDNPDDSYRIEPSEEGKPR